MAMDKTHDLFSLKACVLHSAFLYVSRRGSEKWKFCLSLLCPSKNDHVIILQLNGNYARFINKGAWSWVWVLTPLWTHHMILAKWTHLLGLVLVVEKVNLPLWISEVCSFSEVSILGFIYSMVFSGSNEPCILGERLCKI